MERHKVRSLEMQAAHADGGWGWWAVCSRITHLWLPSRDPGCCPAYRHNELGATQREEAEERLAVVSSGQESQKPFWAWFGLSNRHELHQQSLGGSLWMGSVGIRVWSTGPLNSAAVPSTGITVSA